MQVDESMLMTFRELESNLPIKGKTLRRILTRLGYKRAPGVGRMFFTWDDMKQIEAAIRCSHVPTGKTPNDLEADWPLTIITADTPISLAERRRRTQRILNQMRPGSKTPIK